MRYKRPYVAAIVFSAVALYLAVSFGLASADEIKHATAIFAGLDKITGRIISFEVAIDETVQFGTLQVTPRVCFTRPQTEAPQTDGFVEVFEVDVNNKYKKIFSGWMFADSPGLHGVEHPVYDVWLTDCGGATQVVVSPPNVAQGSDTAPPAAVPLPPPKPGSTPRPAQPRPPNGGPNDTANVPVLGPPVYVPSGADSTAARPSSPRPTATIPDTGRRQPSQRYYPVTPDPDNPYR